MTATEQANARRWGQAWKEAGAELAAIRRQEIRATNTRLSIPAFDGLFELAVRDFPPKSTSGLVEQQRLFQAGRK
jgi:hypothetical protein